MRGFKSIFVSSKHKINCFLIQEKYFQTANAVDTLPLRRSHMPFGTQNVASAAETPRHSAKMERLSALADAETRMYFCNGA